MSEPAADLGRRTPDVSDYTSYHVMAAEGHRIGLMTCKRCGATIVLSDEDPDWAVTHDRWHDRWTDHETREGLDHV